MLNHLLVALHPYWPDAAMTVKALPVQEIPFPEVAGPLRLVFVMLPEWAREWGVDGRIAVPREACRYPENATWKNVDWWLAAFLMLECWHEREWESSYGPIHSWSLRLHGWDERVWDHAWVNRIALFLRGWATHGASSAAEMHSAPLPCAECVMTHDVDAVSKTFSIRIKQGTFNLFKAVRALRGGSFRKSLTDMKKAAAFFFSNDDWWMLDRLIAQERKADIRSHFNFFADIRRKSFKRWLFDPAYDIASPRLSRFVTEISREGWQIGIHPAFDAWCDQTLIRAQKQRLETASGREVHACRQHWLRFSWRQTWTAQQEAGLLLDSTLMFNDRPGFRSAAALQWHPWNPSTQSAYALQTLPTMLMDSHVYDYFPLSSTERQACMARWLDEIRQVHGKAAILWHPHTLSDDYGWQTGFNELLAAMKVMNA